MTTHPLAVAAITFDFGNTLVRVDRQGSRATISTTAEALARAGVIGERDAFMDAWAEERDRQFREEVPKLREVDVPQRAVRVLGRLRGMAPPRAEDHWDDPAAGHLVSASEVEQVVESYSKAFVDHMTPVDDATATLERLSGRGFALAILSNWPLARTIDRFAEAHGWLPYLRAIVVSQRVGTIKPHPSIFRAAETALDLGDRPDAILHVGDDWAADVVGARGVGWRVAYLRDRQIDSPLPSSQRTEAAHDGTPVLPDLEIDELSELDALVVPAGAAMPTDAAFPAAGSR